tara:strand:- start:28 stop:1194 length:1167 start_codon:yes stop_codon:yes gene_type:complete
MNILEESFNNEDLLNTIKIGKKGALSNNNIKQEQQFCKECKSTNIISKYGMNTCVDCGLCNDNVIDSSQEWRYYGSEDSKGNDPSRCGIPTNDLLPESSIGSMIGYGTKDFYNMKKVRTMHYWNSTTYRESSLMQIFNNITILAQNAGISQLIIDDAKYMYKRVSEFKTSRRGKKEAMKAASIMLACKKNNVARTCDEIIQIFNIENPKIMRKTMKTFEEIWESIQSKELNDSNIDIESCKNDNNSDLCDNKFKNINHNPNSNPNSDGNISLKNDNTPNNTDNFSASTLNTKYSYDSINYLHRFCCNINLNDNLYNKCLKLLKYVEDNKLLERHNPLSRVATCLYYVTNYYNIDYKKEIINICNVSDVTINKCHQKLSRSIKIDDILI